MTFDRTEFLKYLWDFYGTECCEEAVMHYPYDEPNNMYLSLLERWIENNVSSLGMINHLGEYLKRI